ncbi:MAG TPA: hypothetical protein VFY06_10125 [Verrucomicrobiae bacterium]|nr:hypothetical protein [Verrucomicrobiae bacterium]
MNIFSAIHNEAHSQRLRFLVIGGLAVSRCDIPSLLANEKGQGEETKLNQKLTKFLHQLRFVLTLEFVFPNP